MTEKEKMLRGELYDPNDPELIALRERAHRLSRDYSMTLDTEPDKRNAILDEMDMKRGPEVCILSPAQFDYGCFTTIGENTFINFNFTCVDCCPVDIGANVFMGPNISILTPVHPMRWQERNLYRRADGVLTDREYAKPVKIEDNCWISGNVTICGGVTIGEGSVIGAGSVVTRDIPPDTFAVGVPCRPLRPITEEDSIAK